MYQDGSETSYGGGGGGGGGWEEEEAKKERRRARRAAKGIHMTDEEYKVHKQTQRQQALVYLPGLRNDSPELRAQLALAVRVRSESCECERALQQSAGLCGGVGSGAGTAMLQLHRCGREWVD